MPTQFIVPAVLADGNELVAQLVAHFEAALPHPPDIAALAARFGMSERTLARHVRAAMGGTTSALLQRTMRKVMGATPRQFRPPLLEQISPNIAVA